ncbi:dihydroxyacetone kinase subunit DhaK [Brachyspira aalborgi]|uniref:dihydroxyacetone kinase subunit DhaK n=1 Tax=Brachyspira aalborgi TaxID=29522 RepID=UPI001F551CF5|nr:dihydroxyacetone kinase subunit DhaK [Brachyspira aalborgi]
MKKIINDLDNIIIEELKGMEKAYNNIIKVYYEPIFITRKELSKKVAIISGGGSGHEPLHGGFVGYGMLDAACPGPVFTSPIPDQMEASVKSVNKDMGVLLYNKKLYGRCYEFPNG